MTFVYSGNQHTPEYLERGEYAFVLTVEGYKPGTPDGSPTTTWGSYVGTLDLEPGETAAEVLANVRQYVQDQGVLRPVKVIFWDLRPNKLPRRRRRKA